MANLEEGVRTEGTEDDRSPVDRWGFGVWLMANLDGGVKTEDRGRPGGMSPGGTWANCTYFP